MCIRQPVWKLNKHLEFWKLGTKYISSYFGVLELEQSRTLTVWVSTLLWEKWHYYMPHWQVHHSGWQALMWQSWKRCPLHTGMYVSTQCGYINERQHKNHTSLSHGRWQCVKSRMFTGRQEQTATYHRKLLLKGKSKWTSIELGKLWEIVRNKQELHSLSGKIMGNELTPKAELLDYLMSW